MVGFNAATLLPRLAAPVVALVLLSGVAAAQANRTFPPGPTLFPGGSQAFPSPPAAGPQARDQVCLRLESQLAAVDSGTFDPNRSDQVRRYEDAANKQQAELDRVLAQSRRLGCEGGGLFSIFSAQNPQCPALTDQVRRMRGNLDRILMDLERLQGGTADRAGQRRAILAALAQNDCGAQYRSAAARSSGGIFDALLGPGTITNAPEMIQSSTFRTICVRSCDGYYFPISFSTVPGRFSEDDQICRRMCPAAEVSLYTHRNPGEDVDQAVSLTGAPYTALPNAFRYRQQFDKSCSCRGAGQSWADALKQSDDQTVERGDIVVTEEQAKRLSQPAPAKAQRSDPRAKTSGSRQPAKAVAPPPAPPAPPQPPAPATADAASGSRQIRSVGPTFIPTR